MCSIPKSRNGSACRVPSQKCWWDNCFAWKICYCLLLLAFRIGFWAFQHIWIMSSIILIICNEHNINSQCFSSIRHTGRSVLYSVTCLILKRFLVGIPQYIYYLNICTATSTDGHPMGLITQLRLVAGRI
jgi:hypothetical protein